MNHVTFTEETGGAFAFRTRNRHGRQSASMAPVVGHYLKADFGETLCGIFPAERSLGPDADVNPNIHVCGRCRRIREGYKAPLPT